MIIFKVDQKKQQKNKFVAEFQKRDLFIYRFCWKAAI
jgi:hypothetical protein